MKRFLICFLVLFVTFGFCSSSFAQAPQVQRMIYMLGKEQLFSVDITDIWNIEMEDGDITGTSDDGKIWFFLGDIKAKDIKEAGKQIDATMEKYFTDINVTSTLDKFTLNGLAAHAVEGEAKQQGKDVIFFAMTFKADEENLGMLVFVMDPAAQVLHLGELHRMVLSLSRK